MTGTVLGVDVGTSGCRVAAYDADLAEVAATTARYPITAPTPDRAEIDADEVWAAVSGCMRKVNAHLAEGPQALAVAVQGETVVPIGADGRVLAMAPIAVDMRAVTETASICRAVGGDRIRAITGQPPHPMFSVGKIAWLRREPHVWQRTAGVHCLGDLIARRLGVEPAIDYTMAARTMAFDTRQGEWSAEILEAAGIPARWMPRAVPVGTELGRMSRDLSWDLGFADPPLVVAGAHDQACALWGAGATEPGQAALSLGTSECLTVTVPGWPAGLAASSFPMYRPWASDRWIVLAGIPSGGASLDWLAGLLCPPAAQDPLSQLISSIPAEPARVLALPHLGGSGTAENDPLSRGAFIGLSHGTSRGELLRALLEASGFEVARNVHSLTLAGIGHHGTARHWWWHHFREPGAAEPHPGESVRCGPAARRGGRPCHRPRSGHGRRWGDRLLPGAPRHGSQHRATRLGPARSRHRALVPAAAPALRAPLSSPPTRLSLRPWR